MPLFLRDRLNHEYWPWYLTYLPLLPLIVRTAIKLRSAVFFSVANPGIDMGGFFGERKSDIYALLPKESYPKTILVRRADSAQHILLQLKEASVPFPLIMKPDVGERGDGVKIIQSYGQLTTELMNIQRSGQDYLLQELVPRQAEFGLMVSKDPDTGIATLLSITGKRFLSVVGDGVRTVADLLAQTHRGSKQVDRLLATKITLMSSIPAAGEEVLVEPIGNHCRGTVFYDASNLITPKLQAAIQQLMDQTKGVYYGRFDVRAFDDQALMDGQFTILELNGVTSEPAHIYDPSFSAWQSWSELYRHHALLPDISAKLIRQGYKPVTLLQLIQRSEQHFGIKLPITKAIIRWFSGKDHTGALTAATQKPETKQAGPAPATLGNGPVLAAAMVK